MIEAERPVLLGYLTALEELTVQGEECARIASSFFSRDRERGPALPGSLQVLRLESAFEEGLQPFLWSPDYHAAAPGVIPTLELRARTLFLHVAVSSSTVRTGSTGMSSLPTGFGSLWIRAERVHLDAGETLAERPCPVTAEQDLCRYLLLAPPSFSEFRMYSPADGPPMAAPELDIYSCFDKQLGSTARFDSLEALAAAMRRTPEAKTLEFSLLRDQQCLQIIRA